MVDLERMFANDVASKQYLRAPRRRGWGRVIVLAGALLIASADLAYGSGSGRVDRVVVAPGDTIWGIAASHYSGDPRPHVDDIMQRNHLASPLLVPGQTLSIPID